uniref:Phloem protein 2-11 n=1 Tax=Boehmeria nivea TaxID=83906 RepID=A0A2Z3EP07_BOENI|nr:phloem protein 2-11 [Boehmeria nivea]
MEMRNLPEECISHIISLTSPKDACRLSLVSPLFRSASDSDAVWENFLPNDYREIVSRRSGLDPILEDSMPKKALFFYLCDNPIIIDNGTMSFSMEKQSGKKCFMIGARGLGIIWGDTPEYWTWKSVPISRFPEVAELEFVCWLEINGRIEANLLSPETTYGAYFVYKFAAAEEEEAIAEAEAEAVAEAEAEAAEEWGNLMPVQFFREFGFYQEPVQMRVNFQGQENGGMRSVFLVPLRNISPLARERGDGWMEVEMGEFFNERGDDGSVLCGLKAVDDFNSKSGLIVEGIEIRPKAGT